MEIDVDQRAESLVGELSESLTAPGDRECLVCYLTRMVGEFGCDNHLRWAEHWRDRNAPRATALADRLADCGGFCDCEVLMNVYPSLLPEDEQAAPAPCLGVSRRGSTKPCRPVPARRRGW
ncbi:MAG TPA: DUF2695 domain-containing protein [Pseudonocardia sp.]|nr:DUF2695 domain-containing protein [Pseudonocardia sp.]